MPEPDWEAAMTAQENAPDRCSVDALHMRKVLGRKEWLPPTPWGNGWWMDTKDPDSFKRILVSSTYEDDGHEWIHASFSYSDEDQMPTYDDLKLVHQAVFGDRFAFQVFAPASEHVNLRNNVLHLWGRADGSNLLPNFGRYGTI